MNKVPDEGSTPDSSNDDPSSSPSGGSPQSSDTSEPSTPATKKPKKGLVAGVISGTLACALLGYGVADAADAVPGILTTEPAIEVQAVPEPEAEAAQFEAPTSALVDTAPIPTGVGAEIDRILGDAEFKGVGIEVRDALSDEVLFAKGQNKARTPASVTKVLTGAAALMAIGGEQRLTTSAEFDPATSTLTLKGGGDSLLGAGESRADRVNGHAGLKTLAMEAAEELKARGVTEVIPALDVSRYPGADFNAGWERNDIGKGIITPIQPLMIDTGYLGNKEWRARSERPSQDAFAVFTKELAAAGITVAADPPEPEATPAATTTASAATTEAAEAGPETVATVSSATISELVEYALVHSDNVVAEVLGREIAIAVGEDGTLEAAPKAVLDTLAGALDIGATHLEDTSGLTYANRITPHDLTTVLRASAVAKDSLSSLIGFMPVAGLTGTLSTRFTDAAAAAGTVHAKTGTLSTVTSLAGGVLTADGRYLVFTLQADGVKEGKILEARTTIDDIVTAFANCGCR